MRSWKMTKRRKDKMLVLRCPYCGFVKERIGLKGKTKSACPNCGRISGYKKADRERA